MQTERPHPKELSTDGEWWKKVTARPGKRSVAGLEGQRPASNQQAPIHPSLFKAVSVRRAVDGLTLIGTVAGKACKLTVDTGSTISIVRPDALANIGGTLCPSTSYLRTVTGDSAPLQGCGKLEVGVGSVVVPHQMWVANITDECILGLDFLQKYNCQVFLKDGVLVMGNQQIPLTNSSPDLPRCYRIIAKESCTVAPWTEAIVPGQIVNRGQSR